MPARYCHTCDIHYPVEGGSTCPLHGEIMVYRTEAEPDEDWPVRARALRDRLVLEIEDEELIPAVNVQVVQRDGKYFISSHDLIRAGIWHHLRDGDLIRVRKRVFEILGHIDAAREYIARPFSMELSEDDLRRLAGP